MIKYWKKVKLEKDDESGDLIWRKGDLRISVNYNGRKDRWNFDLYNEMGEALLQGSMKDKADTLKFAKGWMKNH